MKFVVTLLDIILRQEDKLFEMTMDSLSLGNVMPCLLILLPHKKHPVINVILVSYFHPLQTLVVMANYSL